MVLTNQRLDDSHISFATSMNVREICQPLFSTTPINYFHYGRVYPDGHSMVLITHPDFHNFFWQHHYDQDVFQKYTQEGWFVNNSCASELLSSAACYFDVDNWLLHIKHRNNFIESFGFATSRSYVDATNFYLNHQSILDVFCNYFKKSATKLIEQSCKSLLYTENLDFSDIFKVEKDMRVYDLLSNMLIDNKCIIENPSEEIIGITQVEFLILHYTSCGLSAKMIGKVMNISPRTVEIHLSQIKEKFKVRNKSEMIAVYASLFKGEPPSVNAIYRIFQGHSNDVIPIYNSATTK